MSNSRRAKLEKSLRDQLENASLNSQAERALWLSRRIVEYAWRLQSASETEVFSMRGLVHGDPGTMLQVGIQQLTEELDVGHLPAQVVETWDGLRSQYEALKTQLDRKHVSEVVLQAERLSIGLEAEMAKSTNR